MLHRRKSKDKIAIVILLLNEFQLSELYENIDILNQEGNVEEKSQTMDEESVKQSFEISFFPIDCSLSVFIAQD